MRTAVLLPLTFLCAAGDLGTALADEPPRPPGSGAAAAFAAYRSDLDGGRDGLGLPANATLGEVMSLATGSRTTGPLFTLVAARLVINASADLHNADASPRSFQCALQVRPVGGAPKTVSFLSHDTLGRAESRTLALTTGVAVSPGTYDVALLCSTVLANPGGKVLAADLTVLAFAL